MTGSGRFLSSPRTALAFALVALLSAALAAWVDGCVQRAWYEAGLWAGPPSHARPGDAPDERPIVTVARQAGDGLVGSFVALKLRR